VAHAVPALGAALLTAAGCVWYLPALAEVRAGSDRPDSRRTAAAACLSGWTTVAGVAVLLLASGTWWPPGALAAAGAALTAGLRVRAAAQRRREARETLQDWARLRQAPPPAGPYDSRNLFAALVGVGLTAAVTAAVVLTAAGPEARGDWPTIVLPAATTGLSLTAAIGWACTRRPAPGRPRR
jgi:hypothetical protein